MIVDPRVTAPASPAGGEPLAAVVEALASVRRRTLALLVARVVALLLPMRACVDWREATPGGVGWAAGPSAAVIVLGLFLLGWGLGGRFLLWPALANLVGYRDRLRETLFLPLVDAAFPGAGFAADAELPRGLFVASGLFAEGNPDLYRGSGAFRGALAGRAWQAAELWIRSHHGPSGMGRTYLAFRGFFLTFSLAQPFAGRLLLDPRLASFPTTGRRDGLVEVDTGDPELDSRYRIWCDAPAVARAHLTASRRRRLVALHDDGMVPSAVALAGDRGFVGGQGGVPMLDENLAVAWTRQRVESVHRTLRAMSELVGDC